MAATTIPNTDPASNLTPNIPGASPTAAPTGIIAKAQSGTPNFVNYNGQQTIGAGDDLYMGNLASAAKIFNAAAGTNYSTEEYDKFAHPDTYGARWGIPESSAQPAPASYNATTLSAPTKLDVAPDQTVQGQMKGMIDPNSPYYQQWATAGAQDAAARGFTGNDSLRQTGIIDSVMRNATPIASADASTYAKAAGYNADEANQFAIANQNALNTAGAFNAGQANSFNSSKYAADKSAATQLGVTDKNNATALAQSSMSADTQKYVADQSAATQQAVAKMNNQSQAAVSAAHDANANLIQSNQQAQSSYNSYVAAVAQIDQNDKMDANAKAAAIGTQTQIFNAAIAGLKTGTPGTADNSSPLDVSKAAQQVGGVDVSGMLQDWEDWKTAQDNAARNSG